MDKDIYTIMKELLEEKKTIFTKDVRFMGTITSSEEFSTGQVDTTYDIFMMIDEMPDGSVVQKFYDRDKNFIGAINKDGKIYPSMEFEQEDLSFLGQLEDLSKNQGVSLEELDTNLERVSDSLGISREEILSMSEVDLEQKIREKEENGNKLALNKDTELSEEQKKQNEKVLDSISSKKEESNLDKKIDDKHTMGDILGVEAGCKLIVVYTDSIANSQSTSNSTRFSFIIKKPDGTLEQADMLEQTGGKDSDKIIYETNRDGSNVEVNNVNSSYKITSDAAKSIIPGGASLSAKIEDDGHIRMIFSLDDRTHNQEGFGQPLETDRTYFTTREVREEFSQKHGINNVPDNLREAREHLEHGCDNLTLDKVDGNPNSGHEEIILEIKEFDPSIPDIFTDREIEERLNKLLKDNPNLTFDEVIEKTERDLAEDASRIRGPIEH